LRLWAFSLKFRNLSSGKPSACRAEISTSELKLNPFSSGELLDDLLRRPG
jgi:hypothetical protein